MGVVLSFLLLAAGGVAVVLYARRLSLQRAIWVLFKDGDVREARQMLRLVRWTRPRGTTLRTLEILDIQLAELEGDCARAVELSKAAVARARESQDLSLANTVVNAFINGGAYREALELGEGWTAPPGLNLRWLVAWRLMQVNLAEAEYNLGRWNEALARLASFDPDREPSPLIANSVRLQRAWILARMERAEEALGWVHELDPKAIPPLYWAELHFTRAAVRMAQGELQQAEYELEEAARNAKRASSRRNLLFLRARLLRMLRRAEEAVRLCEEAAGQRYRGQGGDGLLLWGELLAELGRSEEAKRAWELTLDRDPQSEAARCAQARLQGA